MSDSRASRAEIDRGSALLFDPSEVVEVRIPKTRADVVAGYFDNHTTMAKAIYDADARCHAGGVYYVLNRLDPALFGRAYTARLQEVSTPIASGLSLRRTV